MTIRAPGEGCGVNDLVGRWGGVLKWCWEVAGGVVERAGGWVKLLLGVC